MPRQRQEKTPPRQDDDPDAERNIEGDGEESNTVTVSSAAKGSQSPSKKKRRGRPPNKATQPTDEGTPSTPSRMAAKHQVKKRERLRPSTLKKAKQPTDESTPPRQDDDPDAERNIEGDGEESNTVSSAAKGSQSSSKKKRRGRPPKKARKPTDEGTPLSTPSRVAAKHQVKSKEQLLRPSTLKKVKQPTDEGTPPRRDDNPDAEGNIEADGEESNTASSAAKESQSPSKKKRRGRPPKKVKQPTDDGTPPRQDDDPDAEGNLEGDGEESNTVSSAAKESQSPRKKKRRVRSPKETKQPTYEGTPPRQNDDLDAEGNIEGDGSAAKDSQLSSKKKRLRSSTLKKAKQPTDGETEPSTPNRVVTEHQVESKEEGEIKEVLTCPRCEKVFSSNNGLRYHLNKNVCQQPKTEPKKLSPKTETKKQYPKTAPKKLLKTEPCPHCERTFASAKSLQNHLDNKVCQQPKTEPIKLLKTEPCPHCGRTFASAKRLQNHLDNKVCQQPKTEPIKQSKSKTELCTDCGRTFVSAKRLQNHLDNKVCQRQTDEAGGISRKKAKAAEEGGNSRIKIKAEEGGSSSKKVKAVEKGGSSKKKANMGEYSSPTRSSSRRKNPTRAKRSPSITFDDSLDRDSDEPKTKGIKRKRKSEGRVGSSPSPSGRTAGKFLELRPGSKFITRFGVVEVIADDQLPLDHHTTTIDGRAGRLFNRRQETFRDRELLVVDQIAAGTRHRREELKNIYLESTRPGTSGTSNEQEKVLPPEAAGINPSRQEREWNFYCKSLTAKQILTDGLSRLTLQDDLKRKSQIEMIDLKAHPRFPRDYFPDRIVECKLVVDERNIIVATAKGIVSDDVDMENQFEFHAREKTTNLKHTVPMRLFIARRELIEVYNSSNASYVCGSCGKHYDFKTGVLYHMSTHLCVPINAGEKEERQQRIAAIETKALSGSGHNLLTDLHGVKKRYSTCDLAGFGNPHKIKQHKKHLMPPWLVFNVQHSTMYPEMYMSMEFRRGSQNRNHYNKAKEDDAYVPKAEKSRLRKKKKKLSMKESGETPMPTLFAHAAAVVKEPPKETKKESPKGAKKELSKRARKKRVSKVTEGSPKEKSPQQGKKARKKRAAQKTGESVDLDLPSLPPALPPMPSIIDHDTEDVDFGHNEGDDGPISDAAPDSVPLDGASSYLNDANELNSDSNKTPVASSSSDDNIRRRKRVLISKKKNSVVIDTQVLATECESGRYPTINRFYGDHEQQCILCKKPGDAPLINCDFCKISIHQLCLDKRMLGKDPQVVIRENEPHDAAMCHECISVCMFRRSRAESRRIIKWQHELSKAGLEHAPEAASLKEEVNIKDNEGAIDGPEGETSVDDEPTYRPCPDGGPGGLICCSYCTAAYSRFLSNTAKEMEAQSVAGVGQEVSEILELLADAKQRLQRAADVTQSNEERRELLERNQGSHSNTPPVC